MSGGNPYGPPRIDFSQFDPIGAFRSGRQEAEEDRAKDALKTIAIRPDGTLDLQTATKTLLALGKVEPALHLMKMDEANKDRAIAQQSLATFNAGLGMGGQPAAAAPRPAAAPGVARSFLSVEGATPSRTAAGFGNNELLAQGAQDAQYLVSKGYSPVAAAGIVGNLVQESGLRTGAVAPGDQRDGSASRGIAQWDPNRYGNMVAFARAAGRDPNDRQVQLDFIDHELKTSEPRAFAALQAAKTPQEATAGFLHYERPAGYTPDNPAGGHAYDRRAQYATQIAGRLPSAADMPAPGAQAAQYVIPGQPAPLPADTAAGSPEVIKWSRMLSLPKLPEGQRETAKVMLQDALSRSKMPDAAKEFVWARSNGMTQATTLRDYEREKKGPTSLAPGHQLIDPKTNQPIYTAPDRAKEEDPNALEGKLRAESQKNLKTFDEVHDAYGRVIAATQQREANPGSVSPASDIGLVFGFMKMLDPGSVVREGEYATAANAAGIPERVQNIYNKALKGEFLTPDQRQDFINTAHRLYAQSRETAEATAERYKTLATQYKVDPERSVYLPKALQPPAVGSAKGGDAPAAKTKPVIVNGYKIERE